MKKIKRYAEGDLVTEGPNENIGDDTRRRAMEAVRRRMESPAEDRVAQLQAMAGEEAPEAPPARPVARPAPRPAPAPRAATPAGPSFSGTMPKEQFDAINKPTREPYYGSAAHKARVQGDIEAVKGAGNLARKATPFSGAAEALMGVGRKMGEGVSRAGSVVAENYRRGRAAREAAAAKRKAQEEQGYAKGGSVSASRRADGAAMRGKTRGRIY